MQQTRNTTRRWLLTLLALASAGIAVADTAPAPFHQGDRWVAIGDSITHGRRYHSYVYLFYATRFPDQEFELYNAGISGDSAAGAVQRLAWDILVHKPTVATIMLGMNDVGRGNYGADLTGPKYDDLHRQAIDAHVASMTALAQALHDAGCRIILLTPSIYDQTATLATPNNLGVNDALAECGRRVAALAPRFDAAVADIHGPMTALNAAGQKSDPTFTLVGPDRVHPGEPGQFVMAYLLLKAQHVPGVVSEIVVDAAAGSSAGTVNGTVTGLKAAPTAVDFECLENALPYPVAAAARDALKLIPFTADLNRELLRVTGLSPGRYTLLIDGAVVDTASAEQLAQGVNLADNPRTPMLAQAQAVMAVNDRRHNIYGGQLRTLAAQRHWVAEPQKLNPDDFEAVKAAILKQIEAYRDTPYYAYHKGQADAYIANKPKEQELIRQMHEAMAEMWRVNRPRPHKFSLRPATDADAQALSGALVDDFAVFAGWQPTGWTNVEATTAVADGILTVQAPRHPGKRDMLGYTKQLGTDVSGFSTLNLRLRAPKGCPFGVEVQLDGKLTRLASYVPTTGDWQVMSLPFKARNAAFLTLILAEPDEKVEWPEPAAAYQFDRIWFE